MVLNQTFNINYRSLIPRDLSLQTREIIEKEEFIFKGLNEICSPVISQVLLEATFSTRMVEEITFVSVLNHYGAPMTIQQLHIQQRFSALNTSLENRVMPMVARLSSAKTSLNTTHRAPSVTRLDKQP